MNPNGSVQRVEQRLVGGRNPTDDAPWVGSVGFNPSVTFDYDAYGNVRTRSDLSGYSIEYIRDVQTHSLVESTTDSWGLTTTVDWDRRFQAPLVSTDANGHKREVRYDSFGRVTEVFGAYEYGGTKPTVAYEYTLGTVGHVGPHWAASHTIDPVHSGDTIDAIRFVDGYGRTLQSKHEIEVDLPGVGTVVGFSVSGQFVRDSLGRVTTQYQPHFDSLLSLTTLAFAPGTNPTRVEYDAFGRVHVVRAPNGTDTMTYEHSFALDAVGTMRRYSTATFERAGALADRRLSAAWRDLEGNMVRLTRQNTVGGVLTDIHTDYEYDVLGRLTMVKDHAGRKTKARYDSLDRMIELDDPDAGSTEYQYLLSGELGARISPELQNAGHKIYYDYTQHRLTRVRYPSTTWTQYEYGAPGASFNRAGRMWRVTDASGSREYQFTANGEVSFERTELVPFGSLSTSTVAEMSFEFDSLGRATSVTYPPVAGVSETVRYGYDHGGNLSSVTGDVGGVSRPYIEQLTYDHFGRRKRLTLGNGPVGGRVATVYSYDDVNERLQGIDTNTPFGQIQSLRYEYTAHGLVHTIKNVVGTGADRGPTTQEFEYDQFENLVGATGEFVHDDGSSRRYQLSVTYDETGRTTQFNQQDELLPAWGGAPIPIAATTRNDTYSYASGRRHQVSSIGTTMYGFDLNGNQTSEKRSGSPTRLFNWDEEDRLSSVDHDGNVTSFLYDAGGTRTHKSGSSGTTVYPNAFVSIRNGVAVTRHVYAAGQRVSSVMGGDEKERVYWTHSDHLGSTQFTTDIDGKVHEHYEHLPFGESWVEQTSGSDPSAHRFMGRELDQETGLQYVGARYYDPKTTRWLSTDPALAEYMLGDGVGDPRNLSTYAYVFNSPANYVDPDGRQTQPRAADAAPQPQPQPEQNHPHIEIHDAGGVRIDNHVDANPIDVRPPSGSRAAGTQPEAQQTSVGAQSTTPSPSRPPPQGSRPPTFPATTLGRRLELPVAVINLSQTPINPQVVENALRPVGAYFENQLNVGLRVRSVDNVGANQVRQITGGQQLRPGDAMTFNDPFFVQLRSWNRAINRRFRAIRGIRVIVVDDWDRSRVGEAIAMGIHRRVAGTATLVLRRNQLAWSTNTLEHEVGHVLFGNYHADGLRGRENVMYGTLPNGRRVTGEQQDEGRREAARILRGTP